MNKFGPICAIAFFLGACANESTSAADTSSAPTQTETAELLRPYIDAPTRPANQTVRDQYRRPFETLTFCDVEPTMHVVEIWPGGQGGWYRRIVEPFITDNGGEYTPIRSRSNFPGAVDGVASGDADMVLVFRAHGFMIYDHPAQDYVNAVFDLLKPGGRLCIVDHAGDESVPQDPKGTNGYVNESHFRALAQTAGFEFVGASEHNRNPSDTKDHPRGVWSLPPTLAGSEPGSEARARFLGIGESDRFAHIYKKPE